MSGSTALDGLTPAQKEAARYTEGPALVVAGPGSGKTRTLVARLRYLIESGAAPPETLLGVTFTRKAAGELKARLSAELGPAGRRVAVGTFHHLALLLRPLPKSSILLGEADRLALSRAILSTPEARAGGAPAGSAAAEKLIEEVSRRKGRACDWESASPPESQAALQKAWLLSGLRTYKEWQQALFVEDLDDLLIAATRAVQAGTARHAFRFVHVDEYQDINGVQRELLRALVAAGAILFGIGDPDQAIYGFRGAEVAHFHSFAADFPGARRFFLRDNFRATAVLVAASAEVIVRNADRPEGPPPQAMRSGGERLCLCPAQSAMSEAIGVAREIDRLIGGASLSSHDQKWTAGWAAGRYGFSDIAVLTRTAARADRIAEALQHEGVPILRPRRESLLQKPSPALRERLAAFRPGALIEEEPATSERATTGAETSPESAAILGLAHESDQWDERMQRVAVLTLHGAKGLEFPVVFLCGCEAELLPGIAADAADTMEERRLFYVGLTRAKDLVYLSHVTGQPRSPFLDELPAALLFHPPPPKRKPRPPQLKLF